MVKNLLSQDSVYLNKFHRHEALKKNHYLDNEKVEYLMYKYMEGACTDVSLRDEIMEHASELIRQVIKAHNLGQICPGKDETSRGDLFQTCWCVTPDTLVFSEHGIVTIEDVFDQKHKKMYGLKGLQSIKNYLVKDSSDVLEIKTRLGYSVGCTFDHPLYVLSDKGPIWKRASEIGIGDLVGIQFNQQYFVNDDDMSSIKLSKKGKWDHGERLTPDLSYLIGLFVAEGSYDQDKVVIYNTDKEVIQFLVDKFNFTHKEKYQRAIICNARLKEFLQKIGLHDHINCSTKFIPNVILRSNRDNIINFLRGYIDGDGHSNRCGGFVGCTSTSFKLIKQLRMLLNNLGIITKLSSSNRETTKFLKGDKCYISKCQPAHQLILSTINSLKFYNLVGFNILRKRVKQDNLSQRPFGDILFGVCDKFKRLYSKYKSGSGRYKDVRNFLESSECFVSSVISSIHYYDRFSHDEDYRFIKDRISEYMAVRDNVLWLPVTSISSSKSVTYDVEIPVGRSFVSDCIISSNCQIESVLYKYEARPHCTRCYNPLRPNDSMLVDDFWFAREVVRKIKRCPHCQVIITEDSIYYRGKSKIFNLFSQIARTVALAYIKKENRDKKNSVVFQSHLENKIINKESALDRFFNEAREIFKYNENYIRVLDSIQQLYEEDDKPYEGLVGKIVDKSNLPRQVVTGFLKMLRLRGSDFSDSPVNEEHDSIKNYMVKQEEVEHEN